MRRAAVCGLGFLPTQLEVKDDTDQGEEEYADEGEYDALPVHPAG